MTPPDARLEHIQMQYDTIASYDAAEPTTDDLPREMRDRVRRNFEHDLALDAVPWLIAQVRSLSEERDRLTEDAKRLDWLIQHSWCDVVDMELTPGVRTSVGLKRQDIDLEMARAASPVPPEADHA